MTFKKRGGRTVIVLPDGTYGNPAPMATIDNTMIKAIARAGISLAEIFGERYLRLFG